VVGLNLKIGDLDPGAPELRAHSRYNQDNGLHHGTMPFPRSVAVIVKTPRNGVQKYETLIETDRLAWRLQQVPGVQTTFPCPTGASDNGRHVRGSPSGTPSPQSAGAELRRHQSIVNNPNLFNNDGTIMPLIAYLSDHKAETLARVVKATEEFSQQHSTGDRQFLLAAGTSGIEAATNIVVEKAERNMLLYVYSAVVLLCFITFRNWRAVVVAVLPLLLTSILCEALMVLLTSGSRSPPCRSLPWGLESGWIMPVSAQRSACLATDRAVVGTVVQTGRPVHREGGRTGRRHPGGRCRHLGVFAHQVSGRYGHSPYFHVPLEHDWRARVIPACRTFCSRI